MTARRLEVIALPGVPEVGVGDDLVALLLTAVEAAGETLAAGDVVCVAQKIVSKSEGAVREQPPGEVRAARRQVAREIASRIVADDPRVLIVETHHGLVCANGGIDASNLPDGMIALLPDDPDASAARLRNGVLDATGVTIGVIVTDTFGRPWRVGQTEVAIGAAGVMVVRDERGGHDREGRVLEVTEAAIADELAGAADLVRTKADGAPFVLIRGADAAGETTARDLVRVPEDDLFRWGGARAVDAVIERLDGPPPSRGDAGPELVDEALALAVASISSHRRPAAVTEVTADGGAGGRRVFEVRLIDGDVDLATATFGAATLVERFRVLLAARRVPSSWARRSQEDDPEVVGTLTTG